MKERVARIVVLNFLLCSLLRGSHAEECTVESFSLTKLTVEGDVDLPRATIKIWPNMPESCSMLTGMKIRIENTRLPEDYFEVYYPNSCLKRMYNYFQLEVPSSRCPERFAEVPFKRGCSCYKITATPELNNQLHSRNKTFELVTRVKGTEGNATDISFVPGSKEIRVKFKPPVCDKTATVAFYRFPAFLTGTKTLQPDPVTKNNLQLDGEYLSFLITYGVLGGSMEGIKPCSDYRVRVRADFDTTYGSIMNWIFSADNYVTTLPDLAQTVSLKNKKTGPDWLEITWNHPTCKKNLTAWNISVKEVASYLKPFEYEIPLDSVDLKSDSVTLKLSSGKFFIGSKTKDNQLTIEPSQAYQVSIAPKYDTVSKPGVPLIVQMTTENSDITRFDVAVHEGYVQLTAELNSATVYVYLTRTSSSTEEYERLVSCQQLYGRYLCTLRLNKVGSITFEACQTYTIGIGTSSNPWARPERTQTIITPPGTFGTVTVTTLLAAVAGVTLELTLNNRCFVQVTAVFITHVRESKVVFSKRVPASCLRSTDSAKIQITFGNASSCPSLKDVIFEDCRRYEFSLLPELGGKYNGTPTSTEITIEPKGDNGRVQDVSVDVQNRTIAYVQWRLPKCAGSLDIETYRFELRKVQQRDALVCSFPFKPTGINDFTGRLRFADYCNFSLDPCSNYSLTVGTRYRGLFSSYDQSHFFLTPPGEDDGQVSNFKVTANQDTFGIDWSEPYCRWPVDVFQISLNDLQNYVQIPGDCYVNTSTTAVVSGSTLICGNYSFKWESLQVKPCSNYTVYIRPHFTHFGYGKTMSKTFETATASVTPVKNVTSADLGPTYARIEWPADSNPQCIQHYEVTIIKATSEKEEISTFQTNSTSLILEHLTAESSYSVEVAVRLISGSFVRQGRDMKLEFTTPPEPKLPGSAALGIGLSIAFLVLLLLAAGIFFVCKRRSKVKEQPACNEEARGEDVAMLPRRERPVLLSQLPELAAIFGVTSTDELKSEYNCLVVMSEDSLQPTTVGTLPENKTKNRYANIIPFDFNRVKLHVEKESNQSDYINASFIPGLNDEREYIAAQAPKEAALFDFWRMIWEQNVQVIVMLTGLVEKGKSKCEQYWPDNKSSSSYDGRIVMHLKEESHGAFVIRQLGVSQGTTKRVINHFHYTNWPDHGCPKDLDKLLTFLREVRDGVSGDGDSGPIMVHCSAGVGRTGTFIALDMLTQLAECNDQLDIFGTVLKLRDYRVNMVQTIDQYAFLYAFMSHYVQTKLHLGSEPLYGNVPQRSSNDLLVMEDIPL